jgi:hypothetical protein
MGDGQDQQGHREEGVPEQHLAAEAPGGGITAKLKRATTQTNDATIKKELNWQARKGGMPPRPRHSAIKPSVGKLSGPLRS